MLKYYNQIHYLLYTMHMSTLDIGGRLQRHSAALCAISDAMQLLYALQSSPKWRRSFDDKGGFYRSLKRGIDSVGYNLGDNQIQGLPRFPSVVRFVMQPLQLHHAIHTECHYIQDYNANQSSFSCLFRERTFVYTARLRKLYRFHSPVVRVCVFRN